MKNVIAWVVALVALGLVLTYWKLLVGIAVVGALVGAGYVAATTLLARRRDRLNGERARAARLAARAQIQHERYLAGDDRGIYGEYRPVSFD